MSTNDERRSTADVLFGDDPPLARANDGPKTVVGDQATADALFGRKTPEANKTGALWPTSTALRDAFRQAEPTWHDVLGLSSAEQEAEGAALTEDVERLGLDPAIYGDRLVDALVTAQAAERRGTEEDEQQYQANEEEVRRTLRSQYGAARAERILEAAQEHVKGIPRLHTAFSKRGLGSRPDLVLPICEHVRKLKQL